MEMLPNPGPPFRVLLADDSLFMRTALIRVIESDPGLKVVGAAADGLEALDLVRKLDPDLLVVDIEMPQLGGLGLLEVLMETDPRPVIVLSSHTPKGADVTIRALELGAFECLAKPHTRMDIVRVRSELCEVARAAGNLRRVRRGARRAAPLPVIDTARRPLSIPSVVAIGASTGGPKALQEILVALPRDLRVPVLVVQHMPAGFTGPFAKRLDSLCRVEVREASGDDLLEPGLVVLAPAGLHMTVRRDSRGRSFVRLAPDSSGSLHVPSVDALMLSVAETFGGSAVGVILTGMGSDGAQGMKAIYQQRGWTIGQDENSCAVWGMPRACAELKVLQRIVPLPSIADEILHAVYCRPDTERDVREEKYV